MLGSISASILWAYSLSSTPASWRSISCLVYLALALYDTLNDAILWLNPVLRLSFFMSRSRHWAVLSSRLSVLGMNCHSSAASMFRVFSLPILCLYLNELSIERLRGSTLCVTAFPPSVVCAYDVFQFMLPLMTLSMYVELLFFWYCISTFASRLYLSAVASSSTTGFPSISMCVVLWLSLPVVLS